MSAFLEREEVAALTGRKMKSLQIQQLRRMGIPFHINATGHPVVTRNAVEGKKDDAEKPVWKPNVLRAV